MRNKVYLLLAICLLLFTTPAFAVDDFYGPSSGGSSHRMSSGGHRAGGSAWEEDYSLQIEPQDFMQRLYTVMSSPEHLGGIPEVAKIANYMHGMGFFNLSGMEMRYTVSGPDIMCSSASNYAGLDPECYYSKLLALPNAKLRSADLIAEDDYLLYFGVNNLPQTMLLEIEQLGKLQELAEGDDMLAKAMQEADLGELDQAIGMLKALKLDETITSTLSGELAFVIYGAPGFDKIQSGNIQPGDLDLAMFLGLNDVATVNGLIDQFGGQAGLQKQDAPEGWTCYLLGSEPSVGCMYNDKIFALSPNLPAMVEHFKKAQRKHLRLPECQMYFDLNAAALESNVLHPLLGLAQSELGDKVNLPLSTASYLVGLPEADALGNFTMLSTTSKDGTGFEMHATKAQVQYLLYYLGVGICGAAQAGAFDDVKEEIEDMVEPPAAPEAPAMPEPAEPAPPAE